MVISNLISSSLSLLFSPCLPVSCLAANRLPHGPSFAGWLASSWVGPNKDTGWRAEGIRRAKLETLHWHLSVEALCFWRWRQLLWMAPAHGPFPMAAVLVSKEDSTPSPLVLWAEQRSVPHCVDLWVHLVVSIYPGHISESGSGSFS